MDESNIEYSVAKMVAELFGMETSEVTLDTRLDTGNLSESVALRTKIEDAFCVNLPTGSLAPVSVQELVAFVVKKVQHPAIRFRQRCKQMIKDIDDIDNATPAESPDSLEPMWWLQMMSIRRRCVLHLEKSTDY
jgi:hypothetical protein